MVVASLGCDTAEAKQQHALASSAATAAPLAATRMRRHLRSIERWHYLLCFVPSRHVR